MPDEIKINRPMQPNMGRPEYGQPAMQESREEMPRSSSKMPWIVLGIIVVLLVVGGFVFRDKLFGKTGMTSQSVATQNTSSGYVAVFLTNGQVYFGKLTEANSDYPTLTDIYYLQVGPQQGSAQPAQQNQPAAQQQISLVKLGNELHGPVDEMHISRQQILFYENLKDNGQVVKAILQDKAAPAPAPAK